MTSTCCCSSRPRASSPEATCPTSSRPDSASSRRARPSRKRVWSSTSSNLILCSICPIATSHDGCNFHNKDGAFTARLPAQISSERTHERARQVEAQAGGFRVLLKGLEEYLRMFDAAPIVADRNQDALFFRYDGNVYPGISLIAQYPFAVLGQIQKDLHQAMGVCPDRGQLAGYFPRYFDIVLAEGGAADNPELIEKGLQVESRGLVSGLAQLHGRDSFESEH